MKLLKLTGWHVLITATVIVACSFPAVVLHPNSTMFTYGGDGIKNYFTVLYYLQNNSGVHFTGLNYPFGEHLSFADAQPGLIVPFKWLAGLFPSLKNYGLSVINYAVLLGMIAGSVSLYLLLKQFKVSNLFAFAGALLITFLSPQLFRAESHFGLSYIFFLPLGWFLFLKAEQELKVKWIAVAIFFICFIGLLHFYLAAATCLFLLGYAFLTTVTGFKKQERKKIILRWAVPAGSMLVLQLFLRFTDTVTDRPVKPWGFFTALANMKTVFLPHATDLFGVELKDTIGFNEGFAYVGIVTILFLLFYLFTIVYKLTLKKGRNCFEPFSANEFYFLLAGIFILLFSMGIPFIWNMEWLVEKLGFIRQFRGLGRFAWCFYYSATVLAVVYYYRLLQSITKRKEKQFINIALAALCLLWGAETFWRIKNVHAVNKVAADNYVQFHEPDYKTFLSKTGIPVTRYQAILSLPHHHIGSEKFSDDQWPSPYYAMKVAHHTGIPAMAVMLSRTSLLQSCLSMQLTGDSLLTKELIPYLQKDKPLLLLTYGAPLSGNELALLQKAKKLASDGTLTFYELNLEAFQKNDAPVKSVFNEREKKLYLHNGYWSNLTNSTLIMKFTDSVHSLTHAEFVNQNKVKQPLLLDTTLLNYKAGDTLNVSLWIKIEPEKDALPILNVEEWNRGKRIGYFELPFKWSHTVYKNYVCVSKDIVYRENTSRIKLNLHQGSIFGNLLIRKKDEQIFIPVKTGGFYFNNLPVDMK